MQLKELTEILLYSGNLVLFLNLILVIIGFINRNKIVSNSPKWVWYLLVYSALLSLIELFLIKFILVKDFIYFSQVYSFMTSLGIKNFNFISPPSYLIKFIFLSLFFRDLFQDPLKKRFFQYLMYALVVFELVQVFIYRSYQGYDSLSSTVKNVFILGGTGLFMYKLYRADSHGIVLYKNPYFWLTLGLMLPALAEIFLEFIFTKLYKTDLLSFYKLYLVRNASQIVGFTLLIVGVWQAKYLRFLPKEY